MPAVGNSIWIFDLAYAHFTHSHNVTLFRLSLIGGNSNCRQIDNKDLFDCVVVNHILFELDFEKSLFYDALFLFLVTLEQAAKRKLAGVEFVYGGLSISNHRDRTLLLTINRVHLHNGLDECIERVLFTFDPVRNVNKRIFEILSHSLKLLL